MSASNTPNPTPVVSPNGTPVMAPAAPYADESVVVSDSESRGSRASGRGIAKSRARAPRSPLPLAEAPVMMSMAQMTHLLNSVREMTPTPQTSASMAPAPVSNSGRDNFRPVSWTEMPMLECDPLKVDRWFIDFEARMRSSLIRRENWLNVWYTCPKVENKDRDAVMENADVMDYDSLRKFLLETEGPPFPVDFWRDQLGSISATDPNTAVREVNTLLNLHNRAARDAEVPLLKPSNMAYYFIRALPPRFQEALRERLPDARRQPCPYAYLRECAKQLANRAKAYVAAEKTNTVVTGEDRLSDASALLVKKTNKKTQEWRKRMREEEPSDSVLAYINAQVQRATRPTNAPTKRTRMECRRCGRECDGGERCPARNRPCNRCGKLGHWSQACRVKLENQPSGPGRMANPNQLPIRNAGRKDFR